MKYNLMNKNIEVLQLDIDEITTSITDITDTFHLKYLPIGINVKNGVIASRIFTALGFDSVKYDLYTEDNHVYSMCKNFITENTELVTAYQIYLTDKKPNHQSIYDYYIDRCNDFGISKQSITEYLDCMITCDYLIVNTDRRLGNFGFIRDVNSLKFKGFAPAFDSGSSLAYDIPTLQISGAGKILKECQSVEGSDCENCDY